MAKALIWSVVVVVLMASAASVSAGDDTRCRWEHRMDDPVRPEDIHKLGYWSEFQSWRFSPLHIPNGISQRDGGVEVRLRLLHHHRPHRRHQGHRPGNSQPLHRRHALLHMWIPPTLFRRPEALHKRALLHLLQRSVTAAFHEAGVRRAHLPLSAFDRRRTELGFVSSSWVWSGGSLIGRIGCCRTSLVLGAYI
ncbi:hypothetical protein QJS10_CPA10g00375 [Acorus calamus]|uniref:Uncharacterized protein n=1 Tax=Acorus calamus TaxID=4465 RepID=A0AAV9DYF7_ACOCL|nr:hypothetical protein QJS10_CPA10g00375 [Acorus calamus]